MLLPACINQQAVIEWIREILAGLQGEEGAWNDYY